MKYVLTAVAVVTCLVPRGGSTGVNGDQAIGTAELGKMFVGYKIKDAVDQIRTLVK